MLRLNTSSLRSATAKPHSLISYSQIMQSNVFYLPVLADSRDLIRVDGDHNHEPMTISSCVHERQSVLAGDVPCGLQRKHVFTHLSVSIVHKMQAPKNDLGVSSIFGHVSSQYTF